MKASIKNVAYAGRPDGNVGVQQMMNERHRVGDRYTKTRAPFPEERYIYKCSI